MTWLRTSDKSATHPIVLRALELDDADDRILNELYGFASRCASMSASYQEDYFVTKGTAMQVAGFSRFEDLMTKAIWCGYFTEGTRVVDGREQRVYKIVEDLELFHMILKAEADWNAQRKRDLRDPDLTVTARLRDGDACRYCGKSVSWTDRTSARGGTYDHLYPGRPGHLIVACKSCNSKRKDDPDGSWEPLAPPREPLFGPHTVAFLEKHGVNVTASYARQSVAAPAVVSSSDRSPAPAVEVSAVDRSAGSVDLAKAAGTPEQVDSTPVVDPRSVESQHLADGPLVADARASTRANSELTPVLTHGLASQAPAAGRVGSGRDGTGRVGTGREPQPIHSQSEAPTSRKKRSRKRRR